MAESLYQINTVTRSERDTTLVITCYHGDGGSSSERGQARRPGSRPNYHSHQQVSFFDYFVCHLSSPTATTILEPHIQRHESEPKDNSEARIHNANENIARMKRPRYVKRVLGQEFSGLITY